MSSERTRVLVVANRTAATPRLLETVRERARERPCEFSLLVPDAVDRRAGDWTWRPRCRCCGGPPAGRWRASRARRKDPFDAIAATVRAGGFDETSSRRCRAGRRGGYGVIYLVGWRDLGLR